VPNGSEQKTRLRVIILSIVMGIIIFGFKWIAYLVSESTALKSDAIESVVNIVAGLCALGAVLFAGKPADRDHPYGHGKIEDFSAVFEGGLISLAAALIAYEAFKSSLSGVHLKQLDLGLAVNFGAGTMNGIVGRILVRTGRQQKSRALEADGHHLLSDFYTTLGIAAGLVLVRFTGWTWLDPVLGLAVGALLAFTAFNLVKRSANALLDTEDPRMVAKIVRAAQAVRTPDIVAIHALRTLRIGRFTHIDIHVAVPEFYPVERAHELVEKFGEEAIRSSGIEGEFHAHVDPCERLYCRGCAVEPCAVRRASYGGPEAFTIEQAVQLSPGDTEKFHCHA
jgi:cation diffusion facilitator family transporter